ncbi:MAG TPA: DUF2442 domain-containing protein [Pyrinomonadaceae bacterium]|nr:DUF2442 domain-containing protein [Pyrinomonadaceae bacterium]
MIKNTKTFDEKEFERQFRAAKKRGEKNSKLEPRAVSVKHENGRTFVELSTGWSFSFNPQEFSELKDASEKDLAQVKIWGQGYTLEWTNLDAHIGIGAIMLKLIGEKYLASELNRRHEQTEREEDNDWEKAREILAKTPNIEAEDYDKL